MTLREKIAELEENIANFTHNNGSPVGCNMRTLTLQSMYNRLEYLYDQLYQQ